MRTRFLIGATLLASQLACQSSLAARPSVVQEPDTNTTPNIAEYSYDIMFSQLAGELITSVKEGKIPDKESARRLYQALFVMWLAREKALKTAEGLDVPRFMRYFWKIEKRAPFLKQLDLADPLIWHGKEGEESRREFAVRAENWSPTLGWLYGVTQDAQTYNALVEKFRSDLDRHSPQK